MGTLNSMFNSKYSKVLTIILVVVIIAVIGLLGFLAYDVYKKYMIDDEAGTAVSEFENQFATNSFVNDVSNVEAIDPLLDLNSMNEGNNTVTSNGNKVMYKGYEVIGTIEIPKTNVKYPIIKQQDVGQKSLKVAICNLYGELNKKGGNGVLVGHNYRNGTFFSNNKKLSNGDKIYITDNSGKKVTYTIYKKYETGTGDFNYATRKVDADKMEISLSTCTDDSKKRLIIWAKSE